MGTAILSFKELRVYQTAFELQQELFEISKGFPRSETYSLIDQIRRSSRSVGANLAEAWQKRRYPAHFVSKLTDSDGEQAETQHWITTATACGYIDPERAAGVLERYASLGCMIGSMLAHPEKFCYP
jgi:four helix bundle protein